MTSDLSQQFGDLSLDSGRNDQSNPAAACAVAGLDLAVAFLRELIGWPLLYAEEGAAIGVKWPKGILLHGPPGCGKTLVARSVAAEFDAEVHEISAASVFGSYTVQESLSEDCAKPLRLQKLLRSQGGQLSSSLMRLMLCVRGVMHSTSMKPVLWRSCSLSWTEHHLKKELRAGCL